MIARLKRRIAEAKKWVRDTDHALNELVKEDADIRCDTVRLSSDLFRLTNEFREWRDNEHSRHYNHMQTNFTYMHDDRHKSHIPTIGRCIVVTGRLTRHEYENDLGPDQRAILLRNKVELHGYLEMEIREACDNCSDIYYISGNTAYEWVGFMSETDKTKFLLAVKA